MRTRQIRLTAQLVRGVSRLPGGQRLLDATRRIPFADAMWSTALAYRRPFPTLGEAETVVAKYGGSGHETAGTVQRHLNLSEHARPSDYAALFYLERLLPKVKRVFDLGGNVGNLFYSYGRYLDLSSVEWTVMDLPATVERGRELARERGVSQLCFTGDWGAASGTDLLIASGCLHYFPRPIATMLGELHVMPQYLLINRTPLTDGPAVATVQDNGADLTACMLYNRGEVVRKLEAIGYVVEDSWIAAELSLEIPGYSQYRVPSYSGMFLRHRDTERSLVALANRSEQ